MLSNNNTELELKFKRANKQFFDTVADVYDKVTKDTKRGEVISWIASTLKDLKVQTNGEALLDIGCGTGLGIRAAKGIFKRIYGMDISVNSLREANKAKEFLICGEASLVPLKDSSVDVVVCLSVLHHIYYNFVPLLREVFRVLKPGGVLYTNGDPDKYFVRNFYIPLAICRFLTNQKKSFKEAKGELDEELYNMAEFYAFGGVDSLYVIEQLKSAGFDDVKCHYHWYGQKPIVDRIIGKRTFRRGLAPIISVQARKGGNLS